MKTDVIRQRVADFFERHAPFDALSNDDRLELAGSGRVKFHESEEYVIRQGDNPGPIAWVVQQGRVELLDERGAAGRLCDVAGEGDLLGVERFAGEPSFHYSARTGTDVILYGISAELFSTLAARYPAVRRFIQARVSVEGAPGSQNRTSWLERKAPPLGFLEARSSSLPASGLPELDAPVYTRTAVRRMLRTRSRSIAVRGAGGQPAAVLTEADLSLFSGHQPVRLLDEIRAGESRAEIEPLLEQAARLVDESVAQPRDIDESCLFASEVLTALSSASIRLAARELAASGLDLPKTPHCWIAFGASARHDQTRPSTPVLAAVYDDDHPEASGDDSLYFTALAGQTASWLDSFGWGGAQWPTGAQPGMPLSEWKRLYTETIRDPLRHGLFARRDFLDLRLLDGDGSVFSALEQHVAAELAADTMTIALLANDTMNHAPPLAFFQGLAVELDGTRRDRFDIQAAVIAPLAEAARVHALARGQITPASTLDRLNAAAPGHPEAADAFRIGVYYQILAGQPHLDPSSLDKYEQLLLKTALGAVQRFLHHTAETFIRA